MIISNGFVILENLYNQTSMDNESIKQMVEMEVQHLYTYIRGLEIKLNERIDHKFKELKDLIQQTKKAKDDDDLHLEGRINEL